jgi:hypothetical protein
MSSKTNPVIKLAKKLEHKYAQQAPAPAGTAAPAAAKPQMAQQQALAISKDEQEALSRVCVVEGLSAPLAATGKLDAATKAACAALRKKFNVNYTDQQMLTWAALLAQSPKYQTQPGQV